MVRESARRAAQRRPQKMKPRIGEQDVSKRGPPGAHRRENQQQGHQQAQRQHGIACALEHSAHEIDVGIAMRRSHTLRRMVDAAVITVDRHRRFSSVKAKMQVAARKPHRQEGGARDQNCSKAVVAD